MQLPIELVGRKGKCPKCQTEILVSSPLEEQEVTQTNSSGNSEQSILLPNAPSSPAPAPHRGVVILTLAVFGIVTCVLGVVLGPIAIMMSSKDLKQMKLGAMDASGQGQTKLGRIFGIVATVTGVLSVAGALLLATGVLITANYTAIQPTSKEDAAKVQLQMFEHALEFYHLDVGQYPPTALGLDGLRTAPADANLSQKWRGPYLNQEILTDPWGSDYQYVLESDPQTNRSGFRIWSNGADLSSGTDDDITVTSY